MMMEKEVMVAVPSLDFNFNSNCSSPYITAPSSPQHFPNNFFKHHDQPIFFEEAKLAHSNWHQRESNLRPQEEHTHHDQPINTNNQEDEDFEFNFNTHLQKSSLSADQLFHAGKILPLNLISPSHQQHHETEQKLVQKLQQKQEQQDEEDSSPQQNSKLSGKERSSSFSFPSCRKTTKYSKLIEEVEIFSQEKDKTSSKNNNLKQSETATVSSFSSFLSTISISKGYYRKWRIKDFLLFRSASEGRASDKDPLRKYRVLSKTTAYEDVTGSSFRSVENSGSVSKRRKPVSAHELHYTLNRAASEELKRKTMLPYKQGLLGCLGFNHGMNQISGRFGSFERS